MKNLELKYRAWDVINKRMYLTALPGWNGTVQGKLDYNVSHEVVDIDEDGDDKPILMQYTGLKDKNNRDIYEGDIIQFKHEGAPVYNTQIEWVGNGYWLVDALGFHHLPQSEYREVIGNIYENSELLK